MPKLKRDSPGPQASSPATSIPAQAAFGNGHADYVEEVPDLGVSTGAQDPRPRVPPSSPFYLVFVPDSWGVVEGRVIPILRRLSLTPGANGVTRGAGGKPVPTDAIASTAEQGRLVLDHKIDGRSYLRSYVVGEAIDRKTGGKIPIKAWVTRWETLYAGSEHIESDTGGYADWVVSLVEAGKLPPPRPYVLERLVKFYGERLARTTIKNGPDSPATKNYARDLQAVRDAIVALSAPRVEATPAGDEPDVETA